MSNEQDKSIASSSASTPLPAYVPKTSDGKFVSFAQRRPGYPGLDDTQYQGIPARDKDIAVQAYHYGVRNAAEEIIAVQVKQALSQPRDPENSLSEPWKVEDLVAVAMHIDDPIVPLQLKEIWQAQNMEVGTFVSHRLAFADVLAQRKVEGVPGLPYLDAARKLREAPPEGRLYEAIFGVGMCSVVVIRYHDPETMGPPPTMREVLGLPPAEDAATQVEASASAEAKPGSSE